MKKLYLSVIASITGFGIAQAQFLIQSNHAPIIGDIIKTRQCDSTAINPGPSGSSVVWDFSTLNVRPTPIVNNSVTAVPSASTSTYPSANISITPDGSINSLYTTSSADYKYWGGNIVVQTINVTLNYAQPAILVVYPLGMSSSNTSTVNGGIQLGSFTGSFSGLATYTADGNGTLKLPGTSTTTPKTFTGVLRVTTTQVLNFTALVTGTLTQIVHDYYAPLVSKAPLMSISQTTIHTSSSDNTETWVRVFSDYQTIGIHEQENLVSELSVYPNPASGNITVGFTNENAESASCEIVNVLGQAVRRTDLGNDKGVVKRKVSLEGLDRGVYFMHVFVGDKVSVKKVTLE
jgi:hypothetical protein